MSASYRFLVICPFCKGAIKNYADHQNFMGGFTCKRGVPGQPIENKAVLYHQTSEAAAKKIIEQQRFKQGHSGMAGPGIYFATTPEDTHRKARGGWGQILMCVVDLGKVHEVSSNGDPTMNLQKLKQCNAQSVLIPRPNGYEYVIYDASRVVSIKKL